MTINWKNLAVYALVAIAVIWAASELFQWNTERRLAKNGGGQPLQLPGEEEFLQ